ncbi:glycosyltransferase [Sphingomonas panni]
MISVCTLVRGRTAQLAQLMAGLAEQTRRPDELVIAYMQDHAPDGLPDPGVPVRNVFVPGDPMPLAEARNAAAEAARGNRLIFLDVDCVPSPTLVERYADALDAAPAVYLGEVHYLPPGPFDPARGVRHPAKPALAADEIRPVPSHGELWGLSFALPRAAGKRRAAWIPAMSAMAVRKPILRGGSKRPASRWHGSAARWPGTSITPSISRRCTSSTRSCATPRDFARVGGGGAWTIGWDSSPMPD